MPTHGQFVKLQQYNDAVYTFYFLLYEVTVVLLFAQHRNVAFSRIMEKQVTSDKSNSFHQNLHFPQHLINFG